MENTEPKAAGKKPKSAEAGRLKAGIEDIFKNRDKLDCLIFLAAVSLLAAVMRIYLYPKGCSDQAYFLVPWFEKIKSGGGFAALNQEIGDYTPPYYYIMALLTYLPFEPMKSIKTASCLFDYLMAVYVFKIVYHVCHNYMKAALAYGCVLFLPTVFLNSGAWGQSDGIYTAFAVMSLYYVIANKEYKAIIFYAVSFCFKLQSIFIAPMLLLVLMKKKVSWKKLWVFPLTFAVMMLPAVLIGDSALRILGIYANQTGEWTATLSYNAANVYGFLMDMNFTELGSAGVFAAGGICVILLYYFYEKKYVFTDCFIITGTALFSLVVPYLLPYMHERYYYMAVVFIAVTAFLDKRAFPLLIIMEIVSVMGMSVHLTGYSINNWFVLSAGATAVLYFIFRLCCRLINENKIEEVQ